MKSSNNFNVQWNENPLPKIRKDFSKPVVFYDRMKYQDYRRLHYMPESEHKHKISLSWTMGGHQKSIEETKRDFTRNNQTIQSVQSKKQGTEIWEDYILQKIQRAQYCDDNGDSDPIG